jgi:hypothetical protein
MKKILFCIIVFLFSVFMSFSQATGDPLTDFNQHIIYDLNSYSTDATIHTLDMSGDTGGERAFMVIDFESIDQGFSTYGGGDNAVTIYIREKGSNIDWTEIQLRGIGQIKRIYILSDATGQFDVKVENWAPFCYNPGAPIECFGWIQFQITVKWIAQSEE